MRAGLGLGAIPDRSDDFVILTMSDGDPNQQIRGLEHTGSSGIGVNTVASGISRSFLMRMHWHFWPMRLCKSCFDRMDIGQSGSSGSSGHLDQSSPSRTLAAQCLYREDTTGFTGADLNAIQWNALT
jgi:hypothetical protein